MNYGSKFVFFSSKMEPDFQTRLPPKSHGSDLLRNTGPVHKIQYRYDRYFTIQIFFLLLFYFVRYI